MQHQSSQQELIQIAEKVLRQVFGCDEVWTTGVNFFHAKKDGQFIYEWSKFYRLRWLCGWLA